MKIDLGGHDTLMPFLKGYKTFKKHVNKITGAEGIEPGFVSGTKFNN